MWRHLKTLDKHYTPEQLDWLKVRGDAVGEERIREVEAEWKELFTQFRTHMAAGDDPRDASVQELASRAHGLIDEFTGGNPGIEASLNSFYADREPAQATLSEHGTEVDGALWDYMGRAMKKA
jgi:hypothetical protein